MRTRTEQRPRRTALPPRRPCHVVKNSWDAFRPIGTRVEALCGGFSALDGRKHGPSCVACVVCRDLSGVPHP